MPRKAKGPRLYLDRERKQWAIRDGSSFIRTGCAESDNEGAEKKLSEYIAAKYRPAPTPSPVIADVLLVYARERLPKTKAAVKAAHNISNLTPFWGKKRASDVNADNCEAYAKDRSRAAARRDLEVLRAALYYWNKNKEQLARQPQIVLPEKNDPRERWLTHEEAHRLRKAAMKHKHLYRFVILALKTGSRSEVLFTLKWRQVDLNAGVLTRKAAGETVAANKRKPPVRLGKSMVRLMRRWKKQDKDIQHVVHYDGVPIQKLRRSFDKACEEAGLEDVSPHTLRHTRATWLMQEGVDLWESAGHLGMTVRTLENVYAKHHPDFQSKASEV
jgi:integrase